MEERSSPIERAHRQCDAGCTPCSEAGEREPDEGLSGWRLTLTACGSFLLPLATAVAGAALGGTDARRQLIGAVLGLIAGALAAAAVARACRARGKESS